jgi:hypothetical protein
MTQSGPVVAVAVGMRIPALFAIVTMILLAMCGAMVAGTSAAAAGIAGITALWMAIVILGWAPRDGME